MKIVSGKVMSGKKIGRRLGFPTVNVELKEKIEAGVYSGKINVGGREYKTGIFVSPDSTLLEAYLLDFVGNLYGQDIEVQIDKKIRDLRKFKSDDELKKQIEKDVESIKNL